MLLCDSLRDLIVEAKDKGVEIDTAVTRQMLDINVFIYGAVDLDEASTIKKLHQSIELQNALVRCTYTKYVIFVKNHDFI